MSAETTSELDISLEKDVFMRSVLRELMGTLEEVIGREEASGYISVVGQNIADWLNDEYRRAFNSAELNSEQVQQALVDLKKRIDGDFYIVSADREKIVLANRRCPFGEKVIGRPSLCMMTSNVFGSITAENLGYAKVTLEETIADGNHGCLVVINLTEDNDVNDQNSREYFKT